MLWHGNIRIGGSKKRKYLLSAASQAGLVQRATRSLRRIASQRSVRMRTVPEQDWDQRRNGLGTSTRTKLTGRISTFFFVRYLISIEGYFVLFVLLGLIFSKVDSSILSFLILSLLISFSLTMDAHMAGPARSLTYCEPQV